VGGEPRVGALAVLLPLGPRPLPAVGRPRVPHFITSGQWQQYVREGRTLVPVDSDPWAKLRWGVAGRARFAVPQGFTIVPKDPPRDMTGVFNVPLGPGEAALYDVSMGYRVDVTPELSRKLADNLRYLRAAAVVLNATMPG